MGAFLFGLAVRILEKSGQQILNDLLAAFELLILYL